jgi:hypothetical protein
LNGSILALAEAEQLRRETEAAVLRAKYAPPGARLLGRWAAGGADTDGKGDRRSPEQRAAEDAAGQIGAHRESVLWFLRQRLGEVGNTQKGMMETRLKREVEKSRSVLARARGMGGLEAMPTAVDGRFSSTTQGISADEEEREKAKKRQMQPQDLNLTDEQVQMFEKGNMDMLKHYESTLDKVR